MQYFVLNLCNTIFCFYGYFFKYEFSFMQSNIPHKFFLTQIIPNLVFENNLT